MTIGDIAFIGLALATVACGPDHAARKYYETLQEKHFDEAREMLLEPVARFLGSGGLKESYELATSPLALEKVSETEKVAVFTLNAVNTDKVGRQLILVKQERGWKVVDCAAIALAILAKIGANAYDDANQGLSILKEHECTVEATPLLEANLLYARGKNYYEQGSYEHATEALQRALQLNPTADGHYTLGYVYRDNKNVTNNFQRAVDEFKTACEMDPKSAEYRSALADVYRQMENYDGALREFQTALALDPNNLQTLFFYGMTLVSKERLRDAEEQFQKVAAVDPNYRNVSSILEKLRGWRLQQARQAAYLRQLGY